MRFINTNIIRRLLLPILSAAGFFTPHFLTMAECAECDDCMPRLALKTNLLHDALLVPDIGFEISIARRFSVSAEGVWAWWSKDSSHKYWRVYGGWGELRYWPSAGNSGRVLTGHHIGIYGSVHSYDFELGNKGWQSRNPTYSVGASYGYSFRIADRLNLDISLRLGYMDGDVIHYRPQCGEYVGTSIRHNRYFGPTSLEITLVWFPGYGIKNLPDF